VVERSIEMGLFDKKFCDICGGKIGLLGNRKLDDANMCKECANKLSPFTSDRRRTTLAEIKEHLAYREANMAEVESFNVTRTLGDRTKVLLDEDNGKFLVTSSGRWKTENPDVMQFRQVTGCNTEIRESKSEITFKDKEGKTQSYNPPRYDIDYDFYVTIHVNSPFFNEIEFKLNNSRIEQKGSVEFRECERQAEEIRQALTQVRQDVRDGVIAAATPKVAQTCPHCGATTMPNPSGLCEYCGGAMQN
jgi:hypothetical protein